MMRTHRKFEASRPRALVEDCPVRHLLVLLVLMLITQAVPALSPWPWRLIVPIAGSFAIMWIVSSCRLRPAWLWIGNMRGAPLALTLAMIVLSPIVLYGWYYLASPDLSNLAGRLPSGSVLQIVFAGVTFVLVNALSEEIICRGIIQEGLDSRFGVQHGWWMQGIVFGSLHWVGVPQGLAGVFLSGAFGLAAGWVRREAKGLGLACIAHVCADTAIFVLLVSTRTG